MTTFSRLVLVLALFASTLAASVRRSTNPRGDDRYIVVLKNGASKESSLRSLANLVVPIGERDAVVNEVLYSDWTVLNGYAAKLKGAALQHVLQDPNVDYVEEDSIVHISPTTQNHPSDASSSTVQVSAGDLGQGTNIFIIDTGVLVTHNSFGGRASWGAVSASINVSHGTSSFTARFGGYPQQDGNGHGTHVASVAAGVGFGPATLANVIAVKVLSDAGSGTFADVIGGINYAVNRTISTGIPGVINLSIGGAASTSVDNAVLNGIASGVHFTVAAGGSNSDAGNTSPGRVREAVTVGAIDASHRRASFSSFGSVIDVWFLGVSVPGAWISSNTATNILSGTSPSAAGVAGILSVAISRYGNKSPADLQADLKAHAIPDVTNVPAGTTNLRAVVW